MSAAALVATCEWAGCAADSTMEIEAIDPSIRPRSFRLCDEHGERVLDKIKAAQIETTDLRAKELG